MIGTLNMTFCIEIPIHQFGMQNSHMGLRIREGEFEDLVR